MVIYLSVNIEGCMEIQRWMLSEYGEVSCWISHEKYQEYIEYKEKQNDNDEWCILFFLYSWIILVCLYFSYLLFNSLL